MEQKNSLSFCLNFVHLKMEARRKRFVVLSHSALGCLCSFVRFVSLCLYSAIKLDRQRECEVSATERTISGCGAMVLKIIVEMLNVFVCDTIEQYSRNVCQCIKKRMDLYVKLKITQRLHNEENVLPRSCNVCLTCLVQIQRY